MSLFVIADLHLSTDGSKSMDVFGPRWNHYMEKIQKNWNAVVRPEDTVVIPGDVSWGIRLEQSLSDFRFLEELPGKKLIGKGNHDFWWASVAKFGKFAEQHGLKSMQLLCNNAYMLDDCIVSGTRGWFMEETFPTVLAQYLEYGHMINRECIRLRFSLDAAVKLREESGRQLPILVFFHFPPVWNEFLCREIIDILHEYEIKICYFGHIHGAYRVPASFTFEGIEFVMCSADYLKFTPLPVRIV